MNIEIATEKDYEEIALIRWKQFCEENIKNEIISVNEIDKKEYIHNVIEFLRTNKYKVFICRKNNIIVSSMFTYIIPKIPLPGRKESNIVYLTKVYTLKEFRNTGIGTKLLDYVKKYLKNDNCELIFVWPSSKSLNWYDRNKFKKDNDIMQCDLI